MDIRFHKVSPFGATATQSLPSTAAQVDLKGRALYITNDKKQEPRTL
ncbi:MAG: hypothetical protein RI942_348 [Pseudomonadota bacterium]|jgi:hypothetical protein